MPIDLFFRSLALDMRHRAIAVVLSGNGSDGSLGVEAVKADGGFTFAESPESAQCFGMCACSRKMRMVRFWRGTLSTAGASCTALRTEAKASRRAGPTCFWVSSSPLSDAHFAACP